MCAFHDLTSSRDALILQRRGTLTVGRNLFNALKPESVEQAARITFYLHPLGGGKPLPPAEVEKLLQISQGLGPDDDSALCRHCGVCHLDGQPRR